MTRPIQARIHMDALAHNYSVAKQLAPRSQALAVIKADGYGHGYARVVRALADADAAMDGASPARSFPPLPCAVSSCCSASPLGSSTGSLTCLPLATASAS